MLPEGWKLVRLGDIAQIGSGGTPDRSQAGYWNGDIPWVTTGEIQFNTIKDTAEKITAAGLKNSSAKLYPAGTLLMAMYGQGKTRGQVAKLGIAAATSQNSAAILLNNSHDPEFFLHYLASRYDEIRELGNSGGISHLNAALLRKIEVPTGPLHIQRLMAELLSTWDAAIVTSGKFLANRLAQKFALLGELLMPVSAPGLGLSSGNGYTNSVQSGIPKLPLAKPNWRLSSFSHHLTAAVRPAALVGHESYTLVTVRRSRGGVDKRSVLLGSQIRTPTQFYVKSGDFLISKRQIVHGACGVVPDHLDGAIVSNEYAVLNTTDDLDARFLAYLAETIYFQQTCFHSSIGVHIEKMLFNLERWLSWPCHIPPLDVQRRIVEHLDSATEEVRLAERQIELLKTEKRALMADLLTGKRRVRVPENATTAQEPA